MQDIDVTQYSSALLFVADECSGPTRVKCSLLHKVLNKTIPPVTTQLVVLDYDVMDYNTAVWDALSFTLGCWGETLVIQNGVIIAELLGSQTIEAWHEDALSERLLRLLAGTVDPRDAEVLRERKPRKKSFNSVSSWRQIQ